MPLVKRAYHRAEDDDENPVDTKTSPSVPAVVDTTEKSNLKKRPTSSAAESAAKLLKLAESTSNDTRHAIDIANHILHRDQEEVVLKQDSRTSVGPRSLLDFLPSPKALSSGNSSSLKTDSLIDSPDQFEREPHEVESVNTDSVSSSIPPTQTKTFKKKTLSPDVNFDESMLKVTAEEGGSDELAPTSLPTRIVGPVVPAFLKKMNQSRDHRQAFEIEAFSSSASSTIPSTLASASSSSPPYTPHHYDPSFGIPDSTPVVDISVQELVSRQSSAPQPPIPAGGGRGLAGVSRTARSKHQITYLAAVAPETERLMQEKRAERSRAQKFERY